MESRDYDLLPEHIHYRDEGCDLFPACLRCPLPTCRYDEPGRLQREARQGRDREVLRRFASGSSPRELASTFGMSVRTIYRILERHTDPVGALTPLPYGRHMRPDAPPCGMPLRAEHRSERNIVPRRGPDTVGRLRTAESPHSGQGGTSAPPQQRRSYYG